MTDALKEELWDLREQNDALRAQLAARDATIAQLREALSGLIHAPMVAPEHCFNSSHEYAQQDDCGDCAQNSADWMRLDDARQVAARIYAATGAGEEKP